MSTITRDVVVDFATYEDTREATRAQVAELKEYRRVHIGLYLTFIVDNGDTMRDQVQEMMRIGLDRARERHST